MLIVNLHEDAKTSDGSAFVVEACDYTNEASRLLDDLADKMILKRRISDVS